MTVRQQAERPAAADPAAPAEPGARHARTPDRYVLPRHSVLICALVALSGTILLCLRNLWVFSIPVREDTDFAANSILVNQAVHFTLLVGNYREGFNHPGPAFLYLQSFGQDLFSSLLHVVPAPYNGQLLAVFALNSTLLAVTALVLVRHVRSWPFAILALGVIVLLTGPHLAWTSSWMPYLYAAPFLLAGVAGVSVAVGALADLPVFVLAVCLLVHGHIAFVGIMGLYVLVVAAAWLALHRRTGYRAQLSAARPWLLVSGGIVALFALPIVLDLILHWPGQFGLYWHYIRSNSHQHPHTLRQVGSYVLSFWPGGTAGRLLVVLAGVAAAVLGCTDPDRHRRVFILGLLAAVVVLTLEVAAYTLKGVDILSLTYTGYFYYSVPPLLVAVLVLEVLCRVRARAPRVLGARAGGLRWLAPGAVAVVAGVVVLASAGSSYSDYRGDANLPRMAAAVHDDRARGGRGVAISLGVVGAPASDWPDVVGLLVQASRDGYQPCVSNAAWKFMMTGQYICTAAEARQRWTITVDPSSVPIPRGAHVVFRDPRTEVLTG